MLDEDGTEVTRESLASAQGHRAVTPPEDEPLRREEAGVGVVPQIDPQRIAPTTIVAVLQMEIGYGDVLTAVARRTAGLGEPLARPRHEDITLATGHALDIVLQPLVVYDGYIGAVGAVRRLAGESIAAPEVGAGCTGEDMAELLSLKLFGTCGILLDTA